MSLNVLFIDDDPRSLDDFRRLAPGGGGELVPAFAANWPEADRLMQETPFDVVVAAGNDADGEGPAALARIGGSRPGLRRLYVSSDRDSPATEIADQYLWRPFDSERLRVAILATHHLGSRVASHRLAELTRGGMRLPSLPDVYLRMQEEIRSPDPSMDRIGQLVAADPAVSIKVLQIVNSALYGLRSEVGDISQATRLLGMNTVSSLVLAAGVFRQAEGLGRRLVEGLWQESLRVSTLARLIAQEWGYPRTVVETTQLAGLLHDVGDIVFYQNWPDEFLQVDMANRLDDEQTRFGASHADVGGYLVATWGLPSAVVGAVANHHDPAFERMSVPGPTVAVHVARGLVTAGMDPNRAELDRPYLEAVGWADALARFAALGTP